MISTVIVQQAKPTSYMSLMVRHLHLFAPPQMLNFTPHWGAVSLLGRAGPTRGTGNSNTGDYCTLRLTLDSSFFEARHMYLHFTHHKNS